MKPILTLALALVLGGAHVSAKDYREFGNVDGSATFKAALLDVQLKNGKYFAVLERADSKKPITVSADVFREEDRKYIASQGESFALARTLNVTIAPAKDKSSTATPTGRRVTTQGEGFSIKVRNGGAIAAEGVTASYQVVWRKDVRVTATSSKKEEQREKGSLDLGKLAPRGEFAGQTEQVTLTSDRPNPG